MQSLDKQSKLNTYTDRTAHNFVVRIERVLTGLQAKTPDARATRAILEKLRHACRCLNYAETEYKKRKASMTFLNHLDKARQGLEDALDAWHAIPK